MMNTAEIDSFFQDRDRKKLLKEIAASDKSSLQLLAQIATALVSLNAQQQRTNDLLTYFVELKKWELDQKTTNLIGE